MRCAFTIIFNGKHHLLHNNYYKRLIESFDHWIIAEGASGNTGSTSWCRKIPHKYHKGGSSVDGTLEFVQKLSHDYPNVHVIQNEGFWANKDHQVNECVKKIREFTPDCYLWEIDCDEQWKIEDIKESEKLLKENEAKTGLFLSNFYVGRKLLAVGEWGEGRKLPYRRLWDWKGENFQSHEPPILEGSNGKEILLPAKFDHYAYFFEKDVEFKSCFYGGHDNIHQRWKSLQKEKNFPQPISKLVEGNWGQTNTKIVRA